MGLSERSTARVQSDNAVHIRTRKVAAGVLRGRPRDASRDAAVAEATLALLVEVGYDRLSVEGVAARAGVGKATIYRRHVDKAALVAAVIDCHGGWVPPRFEREEPRAGLLRTLRWMADQVSGQQVGLLGAVSSGMRNDRRLAEAMRAVLRRDQAALVSALVVTLRPVAASDPGHYPATTAAEVSSATLVAEVATALIVHAGISGQTIDQHYVLHLVDDVLMPLTTRPPLIPQPGSTPADSAHLADQADPASSAVPVE